MTGPALSLFASTPRGAEPALAGELRDLGAAAVRQVPAGAVFRGDLSIAYRVCLWSRTASRVYLNLERHRVRNPDDIYEAVAGVPWEDHLGADGTLAVSFKGTGAGIKHTRFGAQRVKDGIVDRLRARRGRRPSVDLDNPDLQVSAVLKGGSLAIGIDLVGRPLHQRGYRSRPVPAPLKENLAAAMLLLADWPRQVDAGRALVDPMCGSGTLLIEGAMMAADVAPGLARERYAFEKWPGHDRHAWEVLGAEARQRRAAGARRPLHLEGADADAAAAVAARENLHRAGFGGRVKVRHTALADFVPAMTGVGLLITNPPYGRRLGAGDARVTYGELERALAGRFAGWQVAVLYPEEVTDALAVRRECRGWPLFNGALACRLQSCGPVSAPAEPGPGAAMFANRLRKNRRHLGRWAARNGVHCYRVYDADLPEYAFAVDLYRGEGVWLHVQEYLPPDSVDAKAAQRRRREAAQMVAEVFEVAPERVYLKFRRRQKGRHQYERLDHREALHEVWEGGYRLLVNFTDYLDTGLFLDHRLVRRRVGELAAGGRFLNLFAYTGAATVYAAGGGARETTSVDLSARYLEWARRNLELNGFKGGAHRLLATDCLTWLDEALRRGNRYDVIYVDPPTFSNSRRVESDWDVQRDHGQLIRCAGALLDRGGVLVFSTNARRFRLDPEVEEAFVCRDVTGPSIPEDFRRNPRIHRCWEITARPAPGA